VQPAVQTSPEAKERARWQEVFDSKECCDGREVMARRLLSESNLEASAIIKIMSLANRAEPATVKQREQLDFNAGQQVATALRGSPVLSADAIASVFASPRACMPG